MRKVYVTGFRGAAPAAVVALALAGGCSSAANPGAPLSGGADDASTATSTSSSGGASGAGTSSSGAPAGSSSGAPASSGSSSGAPSASSSGASSGSTSGASSGSGSSGGAGDASTAPDVAIAADASADALSFQEYNLMLINMYRTMGGLAPLTLDSQLSAFALAGSEELTMDHLPHQHFINAGNSIWTMGFNTQAGENQGDPNGWRVLSSDPTSNEEMQIAQILQAMYDEGPPGDAGEHGHYENIMSTVFTRVGVGLVEVNNSLYLTNDFSN